jgi:hypothetical protein
MGLLVAREKQEEEEEEEEQSALAAAGPADTVQAEAEEPAALEE